MSASLEAICRWPRRAAAGMLLLAAIGLVAAVATDDPRPAKAGPAAAQPSLAADARLGRITDVQGVVLLKPLDGRRWLPVERGTLVMPGDWLQAEWRGAHAATIELVSGNRVLLGPGALAEFKAADRIRLAAGEASLSASAEHPIELSGPEGKPLRAVDRGAYRVKDEQLSRLAADPPWLRSFESRSRETLGALIAQVDGRNVALSVGEHSVSVDIRDQLARTVVEESFVNHTAQSLEGEFTFPLPADASISGFGMWIGDELVEADVVERERAREIFETLRRERVDPALLEWSGGNLFKARVWPIPPHSAKRIRLSYTQVLAWHDGGYRYQYPLASDMLKQHPLQRLAIDVHIDSALPLEHVACPTHAARQQRSGHAARVEFVAQSYVPTRDFEVEIRPSTRQSEAVLVTHRRGDDGYFMLQLMPPAAGGDWRQRAQAADVRPLELLVLADTSASIDSASRSRQAGVIDALLASLAPQDKFNLATCDVDCRWAFKQAATAGKESVAAARRFYEARPARGWTDLDQAFASALKQCRPDTQVVYLGDGIPTTGDADPVGFAHRLERMSQGQPGTFHAVALSSSYEPIALAAIARLGGGSLRRVDADHPPATVARQLLAELLEPGLKDLKVELRGLRTASVFPQRLPNLPAGSQQLVLGRYLPQKTDQTCEVVVQATERGKPVEFRHRVTLAAGDEGNSFVPRLWAKMDLDELLSQGNSPAIRGEIVEMSQRYHIITPYTSLLVLESDALRERFQVKRRYEMRDGEKFFAEGHQRAQLALRQQQMQRAGQWRIGLRRAVLAHLAGLGHDPQSFPTADLIGGLFDNIGRSRSNSYAGFMIFDGGLARNYGPGRWSRFGGGMGGGGGGMFGGGMGGGMGFAGHIARSDTTVQLPEFDEELRTANLDVVVQEPAESPAVEEEAADGKGLDEEGRPNVDAWFETGKPAGHTGRGLPELQPLAGVGPLVQGRRHTADVPPGDFDRLFGDPDVDWESVFVEADDRSTPPFNLFPPLPAGYDERPASGRKWPAEARAISQALLRNAALRPADGLEIQVQTRTRNSVETEPKTAGSSLLLISPAAWLTRVQSRERQTHVDWCDQHERAGVAAAFEFGCTRAPIGKDRLEFPIYLNGNIQQSLEEEYGDQYNVKIQPQADDRVQLLLDPIDAYGWHYRALVDCARGVMLELEQVSQGDQGTKTTFSDFVQVAGAWWAATVEIRGPWGQFKQYRRTFRRLEPGQFAARWQAEQKRLGQVQWLHEPLPSVETARQRRARARATFEDRMVLLRENYLRQDWPRMFTEFAAARRLAVNVLGIEWLNIELLLDGRRAEEGQQRLLAAADKLIAAPASSEDYFLILRAGELAGNSLSGNEPLRLIERLKPVFLRLAPAADGWRSWAEQRAGALSRLGRADQSTAIYKQLAERYPHDTTAQVNYASALSAAGDDNQASRWLDRAETQLPRDEYTSRTLRRQRIEILQRQGNYHALAQRMAQRLDDPFGSWLDLQQYLEALVYDNRPQEALKIAQQWLREACGPGKQSPQAGSRISAALRFAEKLHSHNAYALDPGWGEVLPEAAWCEVQAGDESGTFDWLFYNTWFARSDQGQHMIAKLQRLLRDEIDRLPAAQIERSVRRLLGYRVLDDLPPWRAMRDLVRKRWQAEHNPVSKRQLGKLLAEILADKFQGEGRADVLREIVQADPPEHLAEDRSSWFDALLVAPWSIEHEQDALSLVGQLGGERLPPAARLAVRVGALQRVTDRMVRLRSQRLLQATAHPEHLTRKQWSAKRAATGRQSLEEFADRLQAEAGRHAGPLGRWFQAEAITLRIRARRDLPRQADNLWALLPADPAQAAKDHDFRSLEPRLVQRLVTMLNDLAARPRSEPLAARVLDYLDRAIAAAPTATRWKLYKAQLLVALDRPQALERVLTQWIDSGNTEALWRRTLAYLLAEVGRLDAAIAQFEHLRAIDELAPGDQRTLADWYLALDRQPESRQALAAAYRSIPDQDLHGWLYERQDRWAADGSKPVGSDEETRAVLLALLEKSDAGQVDRLAVQYYQASHDEQLLIGLPNTVLGHTAEGIYPRLEALRPLLAEVRGEAGSDAVLKRLREVQASATAAVDRRALDLLEALVERTAAEIVDQPEPHVRQAVVALVRAFDHPWAEGESALMARLLASLGKISQQPLAAEQLRELKELYQRAASGSAGALQVAQYLAATQALYGRLEEAAQSLEAALDEIARANGGRLPAVPREPMLPALHPREPLSELIGYYERLGQFRRGEGRLIRELVGAVDGADKRWLTQRMYALDSQCLAAKGEVALGSGPELFRLVQKQILDSLRAADKPERAELLKVVPTFYEAAHHGEIAGVKDALRAARPTLLEVCHRPTEHVDALLVSIAHAIRTVAGKAEAIEFIVTWLEHEPQWLRCENGFGGWRPLDHELAVLRKDAGKLGEKLEQRLVQLVVAALRSTLEGRQPRLSLLWNHATYFLSEQKAAFVATANQVLADHPDSLNTIKAVAGYFSGGLFDDTRAIEILQAAQGRKLLDDEALTTLAKLLQGHEDWAESIVPLEQLLADTPDALDPRWRLLTAYFHAQAPGKLDALLVETDRRFRQDDRWNAQTAGTLGHTCVVIQRYRQAADYCRQAIAMNERSPGGVDRVEQLSSEYQGLAKALAGLGDTPAAVDAAASAVVVWSADQDERENALETLKQVLDKAADLNAFVAQLDREAADIGQDKPILRRALGEVYRQRGDLPRAIAQLTLAAELAPYDRQTLENLLHCYTRQEDSPAALRCLSRMLERAPRDLKLWEDLGDRLQNLDQQAEAQRAYTSMVEMLPHEAASHQRLAQIFEQQDHWPQAIGQWRQVARLRPLEPGGWLGLAEAQIHEKQLGAARETLEKLKSHAWPERFDQVDPQIAGLEEQLREAAASPAAERGK